MSGTSSPLHLRELLTETDRFVIGVELVSTRGGMSDPRAARTRAFATELTAHPEVDWVSITDNAGGNPRLSPLALGTSILYAGKEVVIHLTCKDLNRHGLESQLWLLASQGFHNLLAMTGDCPAPGKDASARAVFDIDSVSLLEMIRQMNQGLDVAERGRAQRLAATQFFSGAVVNNFKRTENHLLPQYLKLEQKLRCGAGFVINQIGYNSRKTHELAAWLRWRGLAEVPLIGNVFMLSPAAARLFHRGDIPGVRLSAALCARCEQEGASSDRGRRFFREFAAKQIAVLRGLGYRGAYLGGVQNGKEVSEILGLADSFSPSDWKQFASEIQDGEADEFYVFEAEEDSGLAREGSPNPQWFKNWESRRPSPRANLHYRFSKAVHRHLFEPAAPLAKAGTAICRRSASAAGAPGWMRMLEKTGKRLLYDCRDCGDCALATSGFLCPESQCAKNMRNGPCGGSRDGRCEALDVECIWAIAYDRARAEGTAGQLLSHAPVFQDHALRGTSSWAAHWLRENQITNTIQDQTCPPSK